MPLCWLKKLARARRKLIEKEKLEVEKLQFEQKKAADHLERLKKDRDKLAVTLTHRWRPLLWPLARQQMERLVRCFAKSCTSAIKFSRTIWS